jgi:3-oxoadipate enol-lactonase
MPEVDANGIRIYYELHGAEEADVLVLSNGVLMSTASWVFQTSILSQHYRLLLYDCRGMWQSDHPAGPYSMELHADDLAGLLDALGIESAHIGGTSYGAEISMQFALKYPQLTRSLLLTSAVSHIEPELAQMIQTWITAAEAHDPELLFQSVVPLTFSKPWIEANQLALEAARERYKSLDFDAFLELLQCFLRLDITGELHKITAPALVVVGEDDILKPREYSAIIAREIPEAEFVVIPHAGHAALWEQTEIFNSLLIGFLVKHFPPNR